MRKKHFEATVKFGYLPSYEGETIETKVERVVNNKEPITDGAVITYTERKDGVLPQYDVRTDKWDLAQDTMDKVHANKIAKSKETLKANEEDGTAE